MLTSVKIGMCAVIAAILPISAHAACGAGSAFASPEPVNVVGYNGELMEPFLSRDGNYLFFNNSNANPDTTNLYVATPLANGDFQFRGQVSGVNSPALDGVASMDRYGNFYFVSLRDYMTSLVSVFKGQFSGNSVSHVVPVSSISSMQLGRINFDQEISANGERLYFVDGQFSGGAVPDSSEIHVAAKRGEQFVILPESSRIMEKVNAGKRQFAPALSESELELFFTRLDAFILNPEPQIYVSTRRSLDEPFSEPVLVESITGFVEAPTLSPDGCTLYFHKRTDDGYKLYRVTRL